MRCRSSGRVGWWVGRFNDGWRAFEDDDLCGAVDLTGAGDKVPHRFVQSGQVGLIRLQRIEDLVHHNVAVVKSA
jgi:hypothetical protein